MTYNASLQPRRLMMAPAAAGCKTLLDDRQFPSISLRPRHNTSVARFRQLLRIVERLLLLLSTFDPDGGSVLGNHDLLPRLADLDLRFGNVAEGGASIGILKHARRWNTLP